MTSSRTVTVPRGELAYTEAGDFRAPVLVLLHGWPQTRRCWDRLIPLAADTHRVIAFDLPGIGDSAGVRTDGTKHQIAAVLHQALANLGATDAVLVGHDIGGMIAYDYVHHYDDASCAVILDAVIPGVDPWNQVLANPRLWHFAFHATPDLPESLVSGREHTYFRHFFDPLTHPDHPIPTEQQHVYAKAYATPAALTSGFDMYRAFAADSDHNRSLDACATPLLYLRGEHGMRMTTTSLDAYRAGLSAAGNEDLAVGLVPDAVHYLAEENPDGTWQAITHFLRA
ncbi:alpha/beta hydrolase [Microbispora sp. NEAU-D428]|uniref:alpha/beta fold hydrolase n=1 Tax=Microbispora sitophila TaxID=2771537 RepID=UPI0018669D03|nr:alpha/beta hydrolase [Microbispora sitophila]MBE3015074.1 alpha/beta hydrolase [Microbispora sitophila]